jgi:hypothetical protein
MAFSRNSAKRWYLSRLDTIIKESKDLLKGDFMEEESECKKKCVSLISKFVRLIDEPGTPKYDIETCKSSSLAEEIHSKENKAAYNLALYATDSKLLERVRDTFSKYQKEFGSDGGGLLSQDLFRVALKRIHRAGDSKRQYLYKNIESYFK